MRFSLAYAAASMLFVATAAVPSAWGQTALDRVAPNSNVREAEAAESTRPKAGVGVEVDAPSGTAEAGSAIMVGAVTLQGLKDLTPADFADLLASRVGRTLSATDLSTLATAIADRARNRGYPFASAWIGAQQLRNGVLIVTVDEGIIHEIRFDGPVQPAVRDALAPLANGRPVRLGEAERRLLIAGDADGVRIRSSRFFRERDRGILLVRVSSDRVAGRVALSNEGTKPLGPEQLRIDVDFNGLFAADDAVTLTYSGTPAEPGELQFARVRYAKRISRKGTELAVTASGSIARPGAYLEQLDLKSRSWFLGASVLQPISRSRATSLWAEGELGLRDLVQWRDGDRARHDRIASARLTLYGYTDFAGGRLRVSTTASQGLGILGSTTLHDPLASRFDADGTFTSLSAWMDWTRDLGGDFSVRVAAQSQFASQPLLIIEETALGGTGFLRGYDWSERTGDQGVMGSAELRYAWNRPFGLIRRAQLYGFVDGGEVTNLRHGFGGGALSSAGGGVRVDITNHLGANVELAAPLSGPRYDTGDESAKLNFRLVRSF
jgi:hemolysin activation/secretion protein